MKRAWALLVVVCLGCATTVNERSPLRPLPEDGQPLSYAELLTRARLQAGAGTEAFYLNRWAELEEAARVLEQTARLLPKAPDLPARNRDALLTSATDLGQEAVKLREAARANSVEQTNATLQRINLRIRDMRLEP